MTAGLPIVTGARIKFIGKRNICYI